MSNSEVTQSLRIIQVINQHLSEVPECKHDLKSIMSEALGKFQEVEKIIRGK